MAAAGGLLATAIARRSPQPAAPPPGVSSMPPAAAAAEPTPVQSASEEPQSEHPWVSGAPRTLDTLPRRELIAIADALGVGNTARMSRDELIDVLSPTAGSAAESLDRALVRYAAAYAAACREGNPEPILAVTAVVSPTSADAAAHSERMIAEARRRGLLTTAGKGQRGGELTARGEALLEGFGSETPPASPGQPHLRRHGR
jgi:hypothetical protein